MNSNNLAYKSTSTSAFPQSKNVDTNKWTDWPVPYFVSGLSGRGVDLPFILIDAGMHVVIWIVTLVFEILVFEESVKFKMSNLNITTDDSNDNPTRAFAAASLIMFLVAAAIVILSVMAHFCSACMSKSMMIDTANYFPFLTGMMEGGLMSSTLFTMVCVLYTIDNSNATGSWNTYVISLLTFKILGMAFINANVRHALNMNMPKGQ